MKGHGCLKHHCNFHFTRIVLRFANGLRIILTFSGDHRGVGLQLILTWLNVLPYYERISKKHDGVAIGKPERYVRKASHCGSKQQ